MLSWVGFIFLQKFVKHIVIILIINYHFDLWNYSQYENYSNLFCFSLVLVRLVNSVKKYKFKIYVPTVIIMTVTIIIHSLKITLKMGNTRIHFI